MQFNNSRTSIAGHLAIAILMLTVAGCAATGPENSDKMVISTALSSEQTFRNLNKPIRECFTSFAFNSNFYPDAKEGEITLMSKGDIFQAVWIAVDVKPTPTGSSATVTYRRVFEPYTKTMNEWAQGRPAACPN